MKVIELSNKVYLTRHWLRWYFVIKGGREWIPMQKYKNQKPKKKFSFESAQRSLGGDPIIDEKAADKIANKNRTKK